MFSVVIPLYNKSHTIERTLNSIFAQTFTEFEIIIINDGSTDNSLEVLQKFAHDSRLKIHNQGNQGVSAARNIGVDRSNYNYIAFMDGDDEWKPEYLAKMKDAIELFPSAGMYCCAGIVTAEGYEVLRIAKKYLGQIIEIDFFQNPHIFLHTSAAVVRKEKFYKAGRFPVKMRRNEDYALFFSLALITPVVYCGEPLAVYVGAVSGQATNTPIKEVLGDIVDRFNLVFENWVEAECRNKSFKIFMKYELRHMFITHLRDNDFSSNQFLLNTLSPSLLKIFPKFEIGIYSKKIFRRVSMLYILLTKLRWRLRRYPTVNY